MARHWELFCYQKGHFKNVLHKIGQKFPPPSKLLLSTMDRLEWFVCITVMNNFTVETVLLSGKGTV